jgi:predicted membrane-bound dolichyl-phosphate-mannose-protein mannosyltransferase
VAIGSALILGVVLAVAWVVARHPDRRTILVGLAIIAIAFFVVPTRVHERYLFPLMAIGAVLAALSLRWRVAYLIIGTVNFLNLYVVLTTLYPGNPSISDWLGIGAAIRSQAGVTIIAVTHLAVFAWALAQLRPAARESLAQEVSQAGLEDATDEGSDPASDPALGPADPQGRHAPDDHPAVGVAGAAVGGASVGPEALATTPGWAHPIARLRRQAWARAAIPDRSGALDAEPGGRLGRLDLWVMAVLVVATLVFRVDRLAEPYQMHFDEVYHARTATEFLQSWRYGEPHDIYEYTHPHLAKYAMAAGIVLFGEDRVGATSDLGVPVLGAAIERRWLDPSLPGSRAGDRLYLATGDDGLRVHDLATRDLVASPGWASGTTAVAVDDTRHLLYLGGPAGRIDVIDTALAFDGLRAGSTSDAEPATLATLGSAIEHLFPTGDGTVVAATTVDDELVLVDTAAGAELARIPVADAVALADGGSDDALVADLGSIVDPTTAASELAAVLGGSVEAYEGILIAGVDSVVIPGGLGDEIRPEVEAAIADGRLVGFGIETRARVAVADRYGVTFVSAGDGSIVATVALDAPAGGMAAVSGFDEPRLYVSAGERMAIVLPGKDGDEPRRDRTFPMPGAVTTVLFDEATRMVHALGMAPDGSGSTIYVIEPNGNTVYADARLPFDPAAVVLDQAPAFPSADRQQLLALGPDGSAATVEAGRHAFAWRLPGVLAGVLAAALLYLLVRVLFRRRAVAVLAAVVVAVDPMLFAQSRIAMNDAYVGLFTLAAVLLFAVLWTGRWRARWAFWVAMPTIGILLGLALASKWVGAYAIGAIGLLVLIRSALGRVLVVLGLLAVTTVFGYQAIVVPVDATQGGNLTFLLLMMGITLLAVALAVLRPVAWTPEEVRFAIGAPLAAGALVFLLAIPLGLGTPAGGSDPLELPVVPALAFGLMALGGLAWLVFWIAGRAGVGPWAAPPGLDDPARLLAPAAPPPPWWLRLGSGMGLPAAWIVVSLLVIPLVVYVAAYIPWAQLPGNQLWPGFPPDHTGGTLWDLTVSMYRYHDTLRATHPASSPWWAWPLDLKPVWFYQGSFAGGTSAAIYDHGSLVTWWLGIPAMAFAIWQAYRRRSLQLALVVIVFAALWLPWARIDRATFQYHWYTALPFVLIALAYFLAELWHGASGRTWLLARAAAALAIMGPVILWVFKAPLCWFVGVERAYEASPACVGNPGQLVVTAEVAGIALVVMVATIFVVWQLVHLDRPDANGRVDPLRRLAWIGGAAVAAIAGLFVVQLVLPDVVLASLPGLQAELVALLLAIPLGLVAWVVFGARDPRRFVVGAALAAVAWTAVLYPNIAALPLPSALVNAYQGILPTYLYPFQFPVNTDPAVSSSGLVTPESVLLGAALLFTSAVVAYAARGWRIARAEQAATPEGPDAPAATGSGWPDPA